MCPVLLHFLKHYFFEKKNKQKSLVSFPVALGKPLSLVCWIFAFCFSPTCSLTFPPSGLNNALKILCSFKPCSFSWIQVPVQSPLASMSLYGCKRASAWGRLQDWGLRGICCLLAPCFWIYTKYKLFFRCYQVNIPLCISIWSWDFQRCLRDLGTAGCPTTLGFFENLSLNDYSGCK